MLSLITVLTSLACWMVADGEFHHFEQAIEKETVGLPALSEDYRRFQFVGWLISAGVLVWGLGLCRKEGCPQDTLVRFICSTVLAVFLWGMFTFLAVYLMHLKFYRYF